MPFTRSTDTARESSCAHKILSPPRTYLIAGGGTLTIRGRTLCRLKCADVPAAKAAGVAGATCAYADREWRCPRRKPGVPNLVV